MAMHMKLKAKEKQTNESTYKEWKMIPKLTREREAHGLVLLG